MTRGGREPVRITLDDIRLSAYDDNGFLGYQIAALGEQASGFPDVEALHPYGFASRALDPEIDGNGDVVFGCQGLTIWEGSEAYSLALHDARKVPILASLQKGESLQYGPAGNFVRCHADGTVTRFATQDGTPNGQSIYDQVSPTGYLAKTPWNVVRYDATGFHLEHISGAHFDLGSIGGLPAPFDAFTTWCELQAHTIRIRGSAIQLGIGAGAEPVAKATTTLATLGSIASALEATATALTAITAITANSAAGPAVTAAGVAIAAAAAAITAAAGTLPSTSTTVT